MHLSSIPFSDKLSFILFYITIKPSFDFIYQFTSNCSFLSQVYSFATSRALYCSIEPSDLVLISYAYLHPIAVFRGGRLLMCIATGVIAFTIFINEITWADNVVKASTLWTPVVPLAVACLVDGH